jgi:hypothetical protein
MGKWGEEKYLLLPMQEMGIKTPSFFNVPKKEIELRKPVGFCLLFFGLVDFCFVFAFEAWSRYVAQALNLKISLP